MDNDLVSTLDQLIQKATQSPSQLHQDSVALFFNNFKKNGFFVEFGACDGFSYSNSWVMEKFFDWTGILSEPNPQWHQQLEKNRICHIEHRAVSQKTGELLEFGVIDDKYQISKELSGFTGYLVPEVRKLVKDTLKVATISLADMLSKYHAPDIIDYLSMDTEGSELSILESFDFNTYQFNFLTIEHNYLPNRVKIEAVLKRNGYIRLDCDELCCFDDWYIHNSHTLANLVHG
jgi:FkbM family methyltransferase